ncbi:MAG: hypothetical protein A2089_13305 [Elusimicrobia bacterium GWD2_63_28]|nr:MAG: hypothetical protein A2089_13305 [Elusimicrobia bacterium GWD2_63_28]
MTAFFLILSAACLAACLAALARELHALRPGRAAIAAALCVCAAWLALAAQVPARGGYDNEHDFAALSVNPGDGFGLAAAGFMKEISPLAADAAWDAAAGLFTDRPLPLVLWKNRLLALAAAAALGLGAYALAGAAAGMAAAVLCLFSFLTLLNSSSLASTSANLFFLASAVCAVSFYWRRRTAADFYWSLASLWLLAAGRAELALFPLAVFLGLWSVSFVRRLAAGPRGRALAVEGAAAAVYLCCLALWGLRLKSVAAYNGPSPGEALGWLKHLEYQLGTANLALLAPALGGWAAWLAAGAALAALLLPAALPPGDRLRRSTAGGALALWVICLSVFFLPLERYPLHFMRHQIYFFFPAALLFSYALGQAAALLPSRRGAYAVGLAAAVLYAGLNYRAARALDGELRTNDREWQALLEGSRSLPRNCAVVYPELFDSRHALLKKYFRLAETEEALAGSCFVKYVTPLYQTAQQKPARFLQNYNPASPDYAGGCEKPLAGGSFAHKFYTAWDGPSATQTVRAAFCPADTPRDRAWRLNFRASLRQPGEGGEAEKFLREAIALDPNCDVCRYSLALKLALRGDAKGSGLQLDQAIKRDMLPGREALASAIAAIALGDRRAAAEDLRAFSTVSGGGMFYRLAVSAAQALEEDGVKAEGTSARR